MPEDAPQPRPPLSLADLKRKRDEQQSSAARPVFLSKQQRKQTQSSSATPAPVTPTTPSNFSKRPRFTKSHPQNHSKDLNPIRPPVRPKHLHQRTSNRQESLNARERDEIRRHYMRDQSTTYVKSSRSRSRSSVKERSRFRFDWDDADDTTLQDDDDLRRLRESAARSLAASSRGGRQPSHNSTASSSLLLHHQHQSNRAISSSSNDNDTAINASIKKRKKADYDPRHWSDKKRDEMTARDWRIFREDYLITTRSSGTLPQPLPARDWSEMKLPQQLLGLVRTVARYIKPSPIQMAAIPVGLAQRDCIGLAETGSGKTAAFVLPLLTHIMRLPRMTASIAVGGPYALVLAPTRELALQIEAEATKFAKPLGFRVVHIIGGQVMDVQAAELEAGCELVVCTPGRMVDLLSKQMAALANCRFLVLDEADRMIDMGFEPQVSEILSSMPVLKEDDGMDESDEIKRIEDADGDRDVILSGDPSSLKGSRRQTFMFSATMSPVIERLARTYLHEPIIMSIGETNKAADNVTQKVEYFATDNRRRDRFVELLQKLEAPILAFVNTRGGCDMVHRHIEANCGSSVRAAIMHSGKSQEQREATLEGFKSGRYKVLIATDVVGRGIDIKGVRHVINYELPKNIESYTHRIGRTGRAGEKGTAWSLATEADFELFGKLCALLQQSKAEVPREIARAADRFIGGKGSRAITD